jgi:anti-sigma B factor antagonist
MAEFSTSIREHGEVSIVNLKGFLDAHTAPSLENEFTKLIDSNRFRIVVDFRDLAYISSAGLGYLWHTLRRSERIKEILNLPV